MRIIRDKKTMRGWSEKARMDGKKICVVPTMGYLHEGHTQLLQRGRKQSDCLILTLFVNPTQFGPNEDLSRYPRDEAGDLAKAESKYVDVVFAPNAEEMYVPGYQTSVTVSELEKPMCGEFRPGHFSGVATVVTKLFHLTKPHVAMFGQKDFQQLAIIRRMVTDLDLDVEIVGMPTVREKDGLAMSSRNQYLSPAERSVAPVLFAALSAAQKEFSQGEKSRQKLLALATQRLSQASELAVQYLELRDAETLQPTAEILNSSAVLAVAAKLGKTRLIDNVILE